MRAVFDKQILIALFWLLAGLSVQARAGTPALDETMFIQEMPVVLTASRLAQPVSDAPSAITVIDRQTIQASGFYDLADLLRLVPGFVSSFADIGFTSNRTVGYHGLLDGFSRRLQVLVDGRSVYNPAYGNIDWNSLPVALDDIERIEVIRGPNSASYGSNAFMGVINIITRQPTQLHSDRLKVMGGNADLAGGELHHEGSLGGANYWLTLSDLRTRPFDSQPDRRNIGSLSGRLAKRLGNHDELGVEFGVSGGRIDTGDYADPLRPPHPTHPQDQSLMLTWTHAPGPGSELKVQYSHWHYRAQNQWTVPLPDPIGLAPADSDYQSLRDNLDIQQTLNLNASLRVVLGGGARRDQVQSEHYFSVPGWLSGNLYRLFGHVEWHIDRDWLLNAGDMWEDNYISGVDHAPRVALTWTPAAGQAFRIGVSRGFRTPTFFEQYGEEAYRLHDPNLAALLGTDVMLQRSFPAKDRLQSEHIISHELAYLGEFPAIDLHLDVRVFDDDLNRIIDIVHEPAPSLLVPDDTGYYYANLGTATIRGAETELDWRPAAGARLLLNYARVRISSNSAGFAESGPSDNYSLLLMQRLGRGYDFSLGWYGMDRVAWLGDGGHVPGYHRVDLRLAREFRIGDAHAELAAVIQNASGEDYSEYNPVLMFGQRAYVSLSLDD